MKVQKLLLLTTLISLLTIGALHTSTVLGQATGVPPLAIGSDIMFNITTSNMRDVNYYMDYETPMTYDFLGFNEFNASSDVFGMGQGDIRIATSGTDMDGNNFIAGVIDGYIETQPGSYYEWAHNATYGNDSWYDSDFQPIDGKVDKLGSHDDKKFFALYNDTYTIIFPEMQEENLKLDDIDGIHDYIDIIQWPLIDLINMTGYGMLPLMNRTVTYVGSTPWDLNGMVQNIDLIEIDAFYGFSVIDMLEIDLQWFDEQWDVFNVTISLTISSEIKLQFDAVTGSFLGYSQFNFVDLMMNADDIKTAYSGEYPEDIHVMFDFGYHTFDSMDIIVTGLNYAYGPTLPGIDGSYPWGYDMGPLYMFYKEQENTDYRSITRENDSLLISEYSNDESIIHDGNVWFGLGYTDAGVAYYGMNGFDNTTVSSVYTEQNYDPYMSDYYYWNGNWTETFSYPIIDFGAFRYNSTHPIIAEEGEPSISLRSIISEVIGINDDDDGPGVDFEMYQVPLVQRNAYTYMMGQYINGYWFDLNILDIEDVYSGEFSIDIYNENFWVFDDEYQYNYTATLFVTYTQHYVYDIDTGVLVGINTIIEMDVNSTQIIDGIYDPYSNSTFSVINDFMFSTRSNEMINLIGIPFYYQSPPITTTSTTSTSTSTNTSTSETTSTTTSGNVSDTSDTNSTSPPELPLGSFEMTMQALAGGFMAMVILKRRK